MTSHHVDSLDLNVKLEPASLFFDHSEPDCRTVRLIKPLGCVLSEHISLAVL